VFVSRFGIVVVFVAFLAVDVDVVYRGVIFSVIDGVGVVAVVIICVGGVV